MKTVYKVFCVEDNKLKNLFKGLPQEESKRNTRTIQPDVWLQAEKKWSVDGSGQEEYLTGIHCLLKREDAENYLDNFRTDRNRVIVECKARGLRTKPTNDKVRLADELLVPKENLEKVLTK